MFQFIVDKIVLIYAIQFHSSGSLQMSILQTAFTLHSFWIAESSAYRNHRLSDMLFAMSVTCKLNNVGSNIDPCGIPSWHLVVLIFCCLVEHTDVDTRGRLSGNTKNCSEKFKVWSVLISTQPMVPNAFREISEGNYC